jgi:hypothetical protein
MSDSPISRPTAAAPVKPGARRLSVAPMMDWTEEHGFS